MSRSRAMRGCLRFSRTLLPERRPLRVVVLVLVWLMCGFDDACFASKMPSKSEVESVYLFDFGKFVRWPADASKGALRICVAAPASFSAGMEKTVAGEQIEGRPLEVRRITTADEEEGCAMLFIDSSEKEHEAELLRGAVEKPMLTVSDLPGFLDGGGMIQFEFVENRVRFSVNLDAVSRGNLSMSSELLKVALTVRGSLPAGAAK